MQFILNNLQLLRMSNEKSVIERSSDRSQFNPTCAHTAFKGVPDS
jgi:hypothetical protein